MRTLVAFLLTTIALLPQAGDASVAGTVRIEGVGPLGDVRVLLSSRTGASFVRMLASTDAAGRFEFRKVPPGQYNLDAVSSQNYISPAGGYGSIIVQPNADVKDLLLTLTAGRVIAGIIQDTSGKPAVSARIEAFEEASNILVASAETNDRGEYRVSPLRAGKYIVRARIPSGFATVYYPGVTERVKAVPIDVTTSVTALAMNFVLQAGSLVRVAGKVAIDFERQSDAGTESTVYLFREAIRGAPTEYGTPKAHRGAVLAGTNTRDFEFSDVQSGPYFLLATARDAQGAHTTITPLEVGTENIFGITIHITSGVDVTGKLVLAEPAPALAMGTLTARLTSAVGMPVSLGANPINNHEGRMTAAGVFTIPRIAEGSYELSLVGLPGDAVVADVRQNSQSVGNNTILVGSRAPDDLEIIIVRGGTLEGAIRKDGKPVPQGRGYLLAASDFGSRTFIADNAGNFVLRGLVPGPYQFFSLESRVDNPRLGDPLLRSRYAPLAMTVLVAAGDTLTVESTPIPAMDN